MDRPADYESRTGVAQLTRDNKAAPILTVGHGGDFSNPVIAVVKLRSRAEEFDVIHAWGSISLLVAAFSTKKPIVYTPYGFPTRHDIRWLRAIQSVRDVQIICPTEILKRAIVQRGLPIERCHLVRPGVDSSAIPRRRNDELRAKLRLRKDDYVLIAAGESVRGANHHATILAGTVLHVFDPQYKLVLWGKGPMAASEKRYSQLMIPVNFINFATDKLGQELTFEQLLSVADVMLVTSDGPMPTLPIATCMAAGVPIVSTPSRAISELLEDRHTCLMARKNVSRLIARRVLDLKEDTQIQWKIRDQARAEAYEYFSMTRYVEQVRGIYELAVSGRSPQPQAAMGAGM